MEQQSENSLNSSFIEYLETSFINQSGELLRNQIIEEIIDQIEIHYTIPGSKRDQNHQTQI